MARLLEPDRFSLLNQREADQAAVPLGIGVGLVGYMTIGALLVLGGTLAYFLVDPIMMMLDLIPGREERRGRKRT